MAGSRSPDVSLGDRVTLATLSDEQVAALRRLFAGYANKASLNVAAQLQMGGTFDVAVAFARLAHYKGVAEGIAHSQTIFDHVIRIRADKIQEE